MKPACLCGQQPACDQECCVPDLDYRAACLSDSEIRTMLTVLLREWRIRCHSAELTHAEHRYN
jgi:hypothetical protein